MNPLRRIACRFPQLTTQFQLVGRVAAFWVDRFKPNRPSHWLGHFVREQREAPLNDLPLSFAVHAVVQRRYETIIEIGTHDGRRAIALKRLFPNCDVYGLDIQKDFETPTSREGVQLRMFDLDFIRQPKPRSAILSVWVMSAMDNAQLTAFVAAAAAGRHDVIFREITTTFSHPGSIRRAKRSWYHDYDSIFAAHGYRLAAPRISGQVAQFDIGSFDLGYCNLAVLAL